MVKGTILIYAAHLIVLSIISQGRKLLEAEVVGGDKKG